jgi:hypothetical protein
MNFISTEVSLSRTPCWSRCSVGTDDSSSLFSEFIHRGCSWKCRPVLIQYQPWGLCISGWLRDFKSFHLNLQRDLKPDSHARLTWNIWGFGFSTFLEEFSGFHWLLRQLSCLVIRFWAASLYYQIPIFYLFWIFLRSKWIHDSEVPVRHPAVPKTQPLNVPVPSSCSSPPAILWDGLIPQILKTILLCSRFLPSPMLLLRPKILGLRIHFCFRASAIVILMFSVENALVASRPSS